MRPAAFADQLIGVEARFDGHGRHKPVRLPLGEVGGDDVVDLPLVREFARVGRAAF